MASDFWSGEIPGYCLLDGVLHKIIPLDEVRKGDYVEFHHQGRRVRKIEKIHRGRKHQYVQVLPLSGIRVLKKLKLNLRTISKAWRRLGKRESKKLLKQVQQLRTLEETQNVDRYEEDQERPEFRAD